MARELAQQAPHVGSTTMTLVNIMDWAYSMEDLMEPWQAMDIDRHVLDTRPYGNRFSCCTTNITTNFLCYSCPVARTTHRAKVLCALVAQTAITQGGTLWPLVFHLVCVHCSSPIPFLHGSSVWDVGTFENGYQTSKRPYGDLIWTKNLLLQRRRSRRRLPRQGILALVEIIEHSRRFLRHWTNRWSSR